MVLSVRTKSLIKNLAIPLLIGALAGFLTNGDVKEFTATAKQPFLLRRDGFSLLYGQYFML